MPKSHTNYDELVTRALTGNNLALNTLLHAIGKKHLTSELRANYCKKVQCVVDGAEGDHSSHHALVVLAMLVEDGNHRAQLLDRAIAVGSVDAMNYRARMHLDGADGQVNVSKAIALYQRAIDLKSRAAMYQRACLYIHGVSGEVNMPGAIRLLDEAIRLGSTNAMVKRAKLHLDDEVDGPVDTLAAIKLLRQAGINAARQAIRHISIRADNDLHLNYMCLMGMHGDQYSLPDTVVLHLNNNPYRYAAYLLEDEALSKTQRQKAVDLIGQTFLAKANQALAQGDHTQMQHHLSHVPEGAMCFLEGLTLQSDCVFNQWLAGAYNNVEMPGLLVDLIALNDELLSHAISRCEKSLAALYPPTNQAKCESLSLQIEKMSAIKQATRLPDKGVNSLMPPGDRQATAVENAFSLYLGRRAHIEAYAQQLRAGLRCMRNQLHSLKQEKSPGELWAKPLNLYCRLAHGELNKARTLPTDPVTVINLAANVVSHLNKADPEQVSELLDMLPAFTSESVTLAPA